MTQEELALELRNAVRSAPDGEIVVSIHLFGIRRAEELMDHSLKEVVQRSGIHQSYLTEVRKGMKLAEYVSLK